MMGARILFLMMAVACSAFLAPQAPTVLVDRVAAWREDLAFFEREFPSAQKDFDKLYPRPQFDEALGALTSSLPAASDAGIVLGLMRLVASAHVGHTSVRMPLDGPLAFHRLPIGLEWFSDGLAVTAAAAPYRDALGLRITAIGTRSPEALEAAVAPYIAYERDASLRVETQGVMLAEEVLRAVGEVDADGRVALTLARPDGTTFTMRVGPVAWTDRTPMIYVVTEPHLPLGPALVDPARYYRSRSSLARRRCICATADAQTTGSSRLRPSCGNCSRRSMPTRKASTVSSSTFAPTAEATRASSGRCSMACAHARHSARTDTSSCSPARRRSHPACSRRSRSRA
jgi:hypothetical protein